MIRTLVVDDDFRVASIHAGYVERVSGFTVVGQLHTAAAVVSNIGRLGADLVLLDLYLPDHHGLEVLKWLRQPSSGAEGVDAIVITAAGDAESIRAAVQLGAVHYLLKPFGFETLEEKLVAYRERRHQLESLTSADQPSVDRLYAAMAGAGGAGGGGGAKAVPGSSRTLDAVLGLLEEDGGELSASEVAATLGVSRATAQRYLSQLEGARRITMTLRYGSAGRPEHRYRAGGDPAAPRA